ncbi:MAG: hypothetical protein KGH72_02235 [Candidatus Micrarchaeota archaeon]|nr:hypothetical protein [Candidatus Micrarchaeota archaeon]
MLGYIACEKHASESGRRYYIASVDKRVSVHELQSGIVLKVGEVADMIVDKGVVSSAAIIEEDEAQEYIAKLQESVVSEAKAQLNPKPYVRGIDALDRTTAKMWKHIATAALVLIRKLMLGAPVVVRFHNDADGSSGAYCIYRAMESLMKKLGSNHEGSVSWIMHTGVSYSANDASYDTLLVNNYTSVEKPLLMIIDFGTSTDSNNGIRQAENAFDIIWLDHHPIVEGFEGTRLKNYMNPWLFGSDSNYTAGFLASMLGRSFSEINLPVMEDASFIGDYSEYATAGKQAVDTAMILDLLTSDTRIGSGSFHNRISPKEIGNIFKNHEKMEELLGYANNKLGEALDAGLDAMRRHKAGNGDVFVLDFEKVKSEESKYPLPGRYASKLLDRLREIYGPNTVVIVHVGAYISIRLGKELGERIDLLATISDIKSRYENLVEGGGGHRCAASIKLRDKDAKSTVLKELAATFKSALA